MKPRPGYDPAEFPRTAQPLVAGQCGKESGVRARPRGESEFARNRPPRVLRNTRFEPVTAPLRYQRRLDGAVGMKGRGHVGFGEAERRDRAGVEMKVGQEFALP